MLVHDMLVRRKGLQQRLFQACGCFIVVKKKKRKRKRKRKQPDQTTSEPSLYIRIVARHFAFERPQVVVIFPILCGKARYMLLLG